MSHDELETTSVLPIPAPVFVRAAKQVTETLRVRIIRGNFRFSQAAAKLITRHTFAAVRRALQACASFTSLDPKGKEFRAVPPEHRCDKLMLASLFKILCAFVAAGIRANLND